MPRVFAPQQPAKFDNDTHLWIPTMNLKPAEKWGELVVLFPQSVSRANTAPLIEAMKERMRDFTEDDCIIAVGDPALIAAAACISARLCGGKLRMLKWDRMSRDYILVEVKV